MANGSQNMTTDKARQAFYLDAPNEYGYYTDQYGNFIYKYVPDPENPATGYFHLDNNAKTISLRYYWDSGDIWVPGKVGIGYNPTTSGNTYKLYVNGTGLLTGRLTTDGITISNTTGTEHINFSRSSGHNSPNYLNVPANSALCVSVGGAAGTNIVAMFESTGILPYSNNTKSVGTSDYKWNAMYATTFYGALSGNASTATKLSNTPNNTTTFLRGDNTWSNTITGPLIINGTSSGPYLQVNYGSRYDSDSSLDNYGINLIKFGKSALDCYLGTGLNTAYHLTGKQSYVMHVGSSYSFSWVTSGWTEVMNLDNATRTLSIRGTGNYGGYLNLIGKFNTANLKSKDTDRPGITIAGYYPQICMIAGGVNNASHGSTIVLAGYDGATATSGAFKAFAFGTPGQNVTWMDLGYGTSDNPHAEGIDAYTGTRIMRWNNTRVVTHYGRGDFCNHTNSASYMESALQIREYNYGGSQSDTWAIAPRLSWHWSGRVQAQIGLASDNHLYISENNFSNAYRIVMNTGTWGISITGNAATATKATQDENGYNIYNSYNKKYIQIIDLTGQNVNTWYPVTISLPYDGLQRIACVTQLNSGHKPSWSTHNSGYTAVVEILAVAHGWGTTGSPSICLCNDQRFINDDTKPPIGYSQFGNSSRATFWCRGGAKYRLLSDFFGTWTTYTTSTTVSSQTIAPTTTYPGISFNYSTIKSNFQGSLTGNVTGNVIGNCSGSSSSCTGNAASATKLTTSAGDGTTPVYFLDGKPVAASKKLGANKASGYWGMLGGDSENDWIRTTTAGIIPYQSGGAGSGHCGLGTSSWYFSYVYADNFYGKFNGNCTGNAATATRASTVGDGSTNAGISSLGLLTRVSWGTSATSARSAVHHIVMFNQDMGSVWVAGTNDIQVTVRNRDNNQWLSYQSSSGSVNVSCAKFTAKRTNGSANNYITITSNGGANASITIISF